jgi:hypothetical protein
MHLQEQILRSQQLVKQLSEGINHRTIDLKQAEQQVLDHVNRIGQMLVDGVLEGIQEPVQENRVGVGGEVAVFDGVRNLRFINRFGGQTVKRRRCYKYVNKPGGWYPLDERLGLDRCVGYSPLMSYLLGLFGATESFERSGELLGESLGFGVSATAVQRNTEATGARIDDMPYRMIPAQKRQEACGLLVVEIDGTMSPQIKEEEGLSGRPSLKQPTEYKECNLVVLDKHREGQPIDRWIGARYGPRQGFEEYVRRCGLQMGQLKAKQVVFLADGAKSNWEIQKTNFPEAVGILDFYHAVEYLSAFCELFGNPQKAAKKFKTWRSMLLEGEALQVVAEMKDSLKEVDNTHEGWGKINYYQNNIDRMNYKDYRDRGFPIGSGIVEGSCKFVIGKRFKGSGMRWKKADNEKVLKVRLAKLNGLLPNYYTPKPQDWTLAA